MLRMQPIKAQGGNGKRRHSVSRAMRALDLVAAQDPAGGSHTMSAADIARAREDFVHRFEERPDRHLVCKRGVCSFQRVHELCRHDVIEDEGFCDE